MYLPITKISKAKMVSSNKRKRSSVLSFTMSGSIAIGPLINVNMNSGNPKAKQTSKILLPKALEMASSYCPLLASLIEIMVSGKLDAADARMSATNITGIPRPSNVPKPLMVYSSSPIHSQASTRK